MKKTTKRSTRPSVKSSSKSKVIRHKPVFCDCGSLFCDKSTSFWGKDQPMVLLLSAGIVVCIVAGLYLSGWL
ncbi:hypothetical protein KBD71_01885 [Candidatus Woesebacteria bacterium]|nr:hypothetical protein [Candidatus Woesebacteria bacterium]